MDTKTTIISVLGITPINDAGKLLALADVALSIDGVEIIIHGIQVRAGSDRTEITLPKYRAANGEWRAAITLPEEVKGPVGDVVIAAGIEAGTLRERY